MHRFYVAPERWQPDAPCLAGSEAHHCRNVLRLKPGDKVVLFDGRGRELTAEIASMDAAQILLRKLHEAHTPPLRCRITLGQAIPKGKNMDLIVQKAVEIGAAEIAPIISDRTVVRLDDESAAAKQSKWQTIAIEAAKQCGQNWLPQVQAPQSMAQFFRQPRRFDLQLIGSLQSDAVHLKKILAEYLDRAWRSSGERPYAGRSRGRFHSRRALSCAQPWLSPDHAGADRSASGNRFDLLPERSLLRAAGVIA